MSKKPSKNTSTHQNADNKAKKDKTKEQHKKPIKGRPVKGKNFTGAKKFRISKEKLNRLRGNDGVGKTAKGLSNAQLTDKELSVLRKKAVRQAWKQERDLVKETGKGTRDWTPEEIDELMTSKRVKGYDGVKGYEGQHMKSAKEYPEYAGDPDNIQFLKGRNMDVNEHLDAHGGNYKKPTNGYYDPKTGKTIDFGDEVPWKK